VQDDSAQQIAGVYATAGDSSNARLIAAAPDLLAALEEALYWCEQDRDNEDGYPTPDMFAARVDVIAAAIRKARGE
jgi:hypothetical protein